MLKRLYGPRSEKMDHHQLLMEFLSEEAKKAEAAAPADPGPAAKIPKARARRSNKLCESLKGLPTIVREIIHPDVLAAPDEFRLLGEETSERLHVKPSAFTLEIIKRLTHVRKCEIDAVPITAPLAPCLLPGSVLTPSLGAYLLTQKFCYHSTFYREQWKLKASHGIELTRNLMCSWHDHLAERLRPLYKLIAQHMRHSGSMRLRSDVWSPAAGKPRRATSGFTTMMNTVCFSTGTKAAPTPAWMTSSSERRGSPRFAAISRATVCAPTALSSNATRTWPSSPFPALPTSPASSRTLVASIRASPHASYCSSA
ncbi:transposase [bacterium]|nr:transposase [bacterium]